MARPQKTGIDYYPFDVDFLRDIKIRKILKACGNSSISILISLLSSIYRDEGYYVKWDPDISFLVADEVGTNEGAVDEVIKKAIQVDFFDKDLFEKYKILTSRGIQQRYIKACERRKQIDVFDEYMLVDDIINLVNVYINSINENRSTQSKEKKSKVKDSKEKNTDFRDNKNFSEFSEIEKLYNDLGFGTINALLAKDLKEIAKDYSFEWIEEAFKIAEKQNVKNIKYVKGILQNWKNKGKDTEKKKGSFFNFQQHEYSKDYMNGIFEDKQKAAFQKILGDEK